MQGRNGKAAFEPSAEIISWSESKFLPALRAAKMTFRGIFRDKFLATILTFHLYVCAEPFSYSIVKLRIL